MKVKCIWCGSKLEPNAGFCGECDTGPEKNELVCNRCRIKLSSNEKIYHLSESSGCLVYDLEFCKACYEAELVELVMVAGTYRLVSGFLNTMGVELDADTPGWPEP